jgi:thioredoxin-dependent peroxiredoxin
MALKAGDKAPDFTVNDQNGNPVKLSDLRGKRAVIYFYPRDMTPGCTTEACNLRDNYRAMQKRGFEILGVSTDTEKSHKKFIEKEQLPFRLLADTEKTMHDAYGTWVEKSMYGRKYMGTARTTFIIDENGVIENIIDKVDTKNHAAQITGDGSIISVNKRSATKKPATSKKVSDRLKKPSAGKKTLTPKKKGK